VTAIRQATGISRAELARRLSVDPTTVWRWETGRQKPESPAVPLALAQMFQLDLDEALAAAGLTPNAPPARPSPPPPELDPDVKIILQRLADPNVSAEEKTNIRAMLQYLARLADHKASPAKRTARRRTQAG